MATPSSLKRRRSTSPVPPSSNKQAKKSAGGRTALSSAASPPIDDKQWKQWKRQQSHDYNTHQFLDASATVNAGLFSARRLPEIKGLWRRVVRDQLDSAIAAAGDVSNAGEGFRRAGESGGGKISSRHLRRRTNSHRPRRRHRFPRGKSFNNDISDVTEMKEDTVVINGHEKNNSDQQKNNRTKRERCRRARRKPGLMKESHSNWWHPRMILQSDQLLPASNDVHYPHNWLATHLWHAKRFHISPKLFRWSIPLVNCNRGSRASLRLATSTTYPKCTIQDGTWEINGCAIKLEVVRTVDTPASSELTQVPSEILISMLRRLCGSESPILNAEAMCAGKQAFEGILHEIDEFPLMPIGPATFIYGRSSDECNDKTDTANVCILIHPAVHQKVVDLLNKIVSSRDNIGMEVTLSTMPMALLRIRGRASMSTLQNVLGHAENMGLLDGIANHGTLISLEGGLTSTLQSVSTKADNQSWIILKCHQPNQLFQHLPHNLASSGWDIICHPSISASLFQSFVVDGGACSVGVVEDARAKLEAYPPLPVFPRDYPDTEEGRRYWDGNMTMTEVKSEEGCDEQAIVVSKSWTVIRACIDGSWGRINTSLKRTIRHYEKQLEQKMICKRKDLTPMSLTETAVPQLVLRKTSCGLETLYIHWDLLTPPSSPIVIRGSFVIPFLQLLQGCGRLHSQLTADTSEKQCRRKLRRKVLSPESIVHASPLSKEESHLHSKMCQQLIAALSLPGLVRCELYCDGKGAIKVGDLIFPWTTSSDDGCNAESDFDDGADQVDKQSHASPLGIVAAGGFSPCRGHCHGIGFVGAAKLLDALDGTLGMGMSIPQSKQRKMVLKVIIVSDTSSPGLSRSALLSILL